MGRGMEKKGPPNSLLLATAAVIIVWLNRRTMFQRSSGIAAILMPEQGNCSARL
jgi:hypothetical protein